MDCVKQSVVYSELVVVLLECVVMLGKNAGQCVVHNTRGIPCVSSSCHLQNLLVAQTLLMSLVHQDEFDGLLRCNGRRSAVHTRTLQKPVGTTEWCTRNGFGHR